MREPKQLGSWHFPDNLWERDGWDMKHIPKASDDNFNILVDEYNNLAEIITEIAKRLNIDLDNENQE